MNKRRRKKAARKAQHKDMLRIIEVAHRILPPTTRVTVEPEPEDWAIKYGRTVPARLRFR